MFFEDVILVSNYKSLIINITRYDHLYFPLQCNVFCGHRRFYKKWFQTVSRDFKNSSVDTEDCIKWFQVVSRAFCRIFCGHRRFYKKWFQTVSRDF